MRNIEFSNVEVASVAAGARPSFWLGDVSGDGPVCVLNDVSDFHMHSAPGFNDISIDRAVTRLEI